MSIIVVTAGFPIIGDCDMGIPPMDQFEEHMRLISRLIRDLGSRIFVDVIAHGT